MRNRDVNKKWWFLPQSWCLTAKIRFYLNSLGTPQGKGGWEDGDWSDLVRHKQKTPSGNLLLGLDFKMLEEKISFMDVDLIKSYQLVCRTPKSWTECVQSSAFFYPPDVSCWFSIRFPPELGALPGTIVLWLTAIESMQTQGIWKVWLKKQLKKTLWFGLKF